MAETDASQPSGADAPQMITAVHDALDRLAPLQDDAPLAIAVSGGSDSLALLLLTRNWARRRDRRLIAATVNHGLRAEAAEEATWVQAQCKALGVAHETLQWRPPRDERVAQAQARRARHLLLYDWARRHGATHILLGHTHDDVLETHVMRKRAGSSLFGLAGPAAGGPAPFWPEGRELVVIRPLLDRARRELMNWLTASGREWVEDPSNEDSSYERVRARRNIAALSTIDRAQLEKDVDAARMYRRRVLTALSDLLETQVEVRPDGALTVSRRRLHDDEDVDAQLMSILIMAASGAPGPPRLSRCHALRRDMLEQPQGARTLSDAWVVWNERRFVLYRRPLGDARSQGAPSETPLAISPAQRVVWDGRFEVAMDAAAPSRHIVSEDHARLHGYRIITDPEDRRSPDARARRSLPVLIGDTDEAVILPLDAAKVPGANALIAQRLAALASERSWIDLLQ